MKKLISKKNFAEFLGTLLLVFLGCGSAVLAGAHIGFCGIAFTFGLTVMAMAYTIGPISGCHLNPAVTVSMLAVGKIKSGEALGYIVGQIAGAIAGATLLYFIANGNPHYNLAANGLGQNGVENGSPDGYSLLSGFLAEVIFTAIFLFVIHGITNKTNEENGKFAGIVIGLTLTVIHLVGIPLTGVSVNPARSIGPALFVGGQALSNLWVFIVGPLIGGLLGGGIWLLLEEDSH